MKKNLFTQIMEKLEDRKRYSVRRKVLTGLSCAVIFCATYALILPALTLEKDCPLEEHTHTEECYAMVTVKKPVCTVDSLGIHQHDESCYDEEGNLICGYADHVIHVHDESCYDSHGELICGLPELVPHQHTEECWETQRLLTCGQEEVPAHHHTEDCYDPSGKLICGLEETDGHKHTDECYTEKKVLVCGLPEAIEHTHTDECYDENGKLICGLPELHSHVHGPECFAAVEEKQLICQKPEHVHTNECMPGIEEARPSADPLIDFDDDDTIVLPIVPIGPTPSPSPQPTEAPLEQRALTAQLDDALVEVSGLLPPEAMLVAQPVQAQVDGQTVLLALDLRLELPDHSVYEPKEGTFAVQIHSQILESTPGQVYYLPEGSAPERVPTRSSGKKVSFEAQHFSVYAVVAWVEDIFEEGTLSTGHTWCIDSTSGTPMLVIRGEGALPDFASPEDTPWFPYASQNAEVVIGEGVTGIGRNAFANMALRSVRFTGKTHIIGPDAFRGVTGLRSLTLPGSLTKISAGAFADCPQLTNISLPAGTVLTLEADAFVNTNVHVSGLSGRITSDKNGVACILKDDGTAVAARVPAGIENVTIPAVLTTADGSSYTVTAVAPDFMQYAAGCKRLTFEAPAAIQALGDRAFANCPSLILINHEGSETDILRTFTHPGLVKGADLFAGTDLLPSLHPTPHPVGPEAVDETGRENLLVKKEGASSLKIELDDKSKDFYWNKADQEYERILTGQAFSVTASCRRNDTDMEAVYRVYIQHNGEYFDPIYVPGETYSFTSGGAVQKVVCHAVENDPKTIYMEWEPQVGQTVAIPFRMLFNSPQADGGRAKIWGVILSQADAAAYNGKMVASTSGAIYAEWSVKEATFIQEVHKIGENSSQISLKAYQETDSEGNRVVVPRPRDMIWSASLSPQEGTLTDIGKNLAQTVDYTVSFDLPTGIIWDPEIKEAIQNGRLKFREVEHNVGGSGRPAKWILYQERPDPTRPGKNIVLDLLELYYGDARTSLANIPFSVSSMKMTWDAELDQPLLTWTTATRNPEEELKTQKIGILVRPQCMRVDSDTYVPEDPLRPGIPNPANLVTCAVRSLTHFQHNGVVQDSQAATAAPIVTLRGTPVFEYRYSGSANEQNGGTYGDLLNFQLVLKNPEVLPVQGREDAVYSSTEDLDAHLFVEGPEMERVIREAELNGQTAEFTIRNARLGDPWQQVTAADGSIAWLHGGNSNQEGHTHLDPAHTLRLYRNAAHQWCVEVDGDAAQVHTGGSFESILRALGYYISNDCFYRLDRVFNPDGETLKLGTLETFNMDLRLRTKHAFQSLSVDHLMNYPDSSDNAISNNAKVVSKAPSEHKPLDVYEKSIAASSSCPSNVVKGTVLDSDDPTATVVDGSVLSSTLTLSLNREEYRNLPVVDDLTGPHYLMAEVSKNPALASMGLPVVKGAGFGKDAGKELDYYLLSKPGTYHNVVLGNDDHGPEGSLRDLTAAVVTVAEDSSQVKWYYGEQGLDPVLAKGTRAQTKIRYKTMVQMTGDSTGLVNNKVWLNDRYDTVSSGGTSPFGARLYYSAGLQATQFSLKKQHVINKGATPDKDVLNSASLLTVDAGDQVTYRLDIIRKGSLPVWLSGSDLADALPITNGVFQWKKGVNVTDFSFAVSDPACITVDAEALNSWVVNDEPYKALSQPGERQYMRWPDDMTILFDPAGEDKELTLSLYITLTWPRDKDGESFWTDYVESLQGGYADNTLYVYSFPSTIQHELRGVNRAVLQKGVLHNDSRPGLIPLTRHKYIRGSKVTYYIALYNGGSNRLYLDTIYDRLPLSFDTAVFDFNNLKVINDGSGKHYYTYGSMSTANQAAELPAGVVYRSAEITKRVSRPAGDQPAIVEFDVGAAYPGAKYPVQQDDHGFYLGHNDALVFAYTVHTTQEEMDQVNTAAMPFHDPFETGTRLIPSEELPIYGKEINNGVRYNDQNDGSRMLLTDQDVYDRYGFDRRMIHPEDKWLVSDVTVSGELIIPGIVKSTVAHAASSTSEREPYEGSASPFDVIYWDVDLSTQSASEISSFVFTDVMPKPYSFCQEIVFGGTHIGIKPRQPGDSVVYLFDPAYPDVTTPVTINGFYAFYDGLMIQLKTDPNGNEVLQITSTSRHRIRRDAPFHVEVAGQNLTSIKKNAVYINQAFLTPTGQQFRRVGVGSLIPKGLNPLLPSVNSSVASAAPVVVSTLKITPSRKYVWQTDDPSNKAVSDGAVNYIEVAEPLQSRNITYALEVENETSRAMSHLTLIDTLPHPGDGHPFDPDVPRGSQFTVSLPADPNFRVLVTDKDGHRTQLSGDDFTVEYSPDALFGEQDGPDWTGAPIGTPGMTAHWMTAPDEHTQAFRVVLHDESGTKLPKGASIQVLFDAVIGEDVSVDAIAWNSFGYYYRLADTPDGMSAMPAPVGVKILPWSLVLNKVDAANHDLKLDDAWFGIYSPSQLDLISDEDLAALAVKPQNTVIEQDGRKWYLVDARPTVRGRLVFDSLLRGEYYLEELQPPRGYGIIDLYTHVVCNPGTAVKEITIENRVSYNLPHTGGPGTLPFRLIGGLLTAGAAAVWFYSRRRRERRIL